MASLQRLAEAELEKDGSTDDAHSFRPTSKDTDPYQEDEAQTGSAALGGGLDSPPRPRNFGTPARGDDGAFGAFGMTADTIGFPSMLHRDNFPHQTPQHRSESHHEPMSPTDTNPYQSPDNEKSEPETDDSDVQNAHLPGLGGFPVDQGGLPGLGGFPGASGLRGGQPFDLPGHERSQTSSSGQNRPFPSLGGLGGLPGLGTPGTWSSGPGTIGTPTRDRTAFGTGFQETPFSSAADALSPALAGLGSSSLFGAPGFGLGTGSIGRGSKIGALFPPAMQEQIRQQAEPPRRSLDEGSFDGFDRHQGGFGGFGRGAFGGGLFGAQGPVRDTDSPFRVGRGIFDEGFSAAIRQAQLASTIGDPLGTTLSQLQASTTAVAGIPTTQPQLQRQPSTVTSPGSDQPPVAQQKTMVMPDRMRWIYKDPQGSVQGPWTGLEMHDWYKAGFFTPELLIKKVEDTEYEPLAQLIRRIGNSREPFLVPQVGVPHDPPNGQRNWTSPTAGQTQPPFAGAFPSFGTTLTADQQNALERRKQEEQYLMARQKEHLAQQQLIQKQFALQQAQYGMSQMLPQQIHHQSSAHSLQSQPSVGSMAGATVTSPSAYQPSPTQGPVPGGQAPGFFDNSFRPPPGGPLSSLGVGLEGLGHIREEEIPGLMERLTMGAPNARAPVGGTAGPLGQHPLDHPGLAQQVQQMMSDRLQLLQEQAEHDTLSQRLGPDQTAAQASLDRLRQFRDLRASREQSLEQLDGDEDITEVIQTIKTQHKLDPIQTDISSPAQAQQSQPATLKQNEQPTLTEQVQKAQSAKQTAQKAVWQTIEVGTILPPPPSQSPMPAPVAQRKQNLADTLAAESRSQTQSPAVETPSASIAPWAKETVEAPKGPSLKEIQEMEAKKAQQAEALAAAARREQFEKELAAQAAAVAAQPQPGLPSTSTWASGQSPGGATPASVWAKPAVSKAPGINVAAPKKTLQQIQKEEEARKQRAAAAASAASAANSMASTQSAAGKRYADLIGKNVASPPPTAGGAWTTVGAGGRAKAPPIPTAPAVATRVVSGSIPTMPPVAKVKPVQRSTTMGTAQLSKVEALSSFKEWAVAELRSHLSKGVNGRLQRAQTHAAINADLPCQ
jgi:PERQ amino acid-rich with GYF domain-containing protein